MFKDKKLIEKVKRLEQTVGELDNKYWKISNAFAKHLNIQLLSKDIVEFDWFTGKKVGYEFEVVPLKKEKKVSKKKNKKSKK